MCCRTHGSICYTTKYFVLLICKRGERRKWGSSFDACYLCLPKAKTFPSSKAVLDEDLKPLGHGGKGRSLHRVVAPAVLNQVPKRPRDVLWHGWPRSVYDPAVQRCLKGPVPRAVASPSGGAVVERVPAGPIPAAAIAAGREGPHPRQNSDAVRLHLTLLPRPKPARGILGLCLQGRHSLARDRCRCLLNDRRVVWVIEVGPIVHRIVYAALQQPKGPGPA
mmetsp:Transcript_11275/g.34395  ORF Transcript_11275/g.34395 Transcript_11275/m.34395 type:complete len:221 (-) Transcript_11275:870-1532(-)